MGHGDGYGDFPAYVSAAERRRKAARELARLRQQGQVADPVVIEGRHIASTFWGKAWCEHLEGYADLASRLPRGRTYARNGSVVDLQIDPGEVRAVVVGSEVYHASVRVKPLASQRWTAVRAACAGQIGTVVELLSGKLSGAVMAELCHRERGLFPASRELTLRCSCPDGARLCKHLAAVLYGVGARLDRAPELLFTLRGVDGAELVAAASTGEHLTSGAAAGEGLRADVDLGAIFGIELEVARPADAPDADPALPVPPRGRPSPTRAAVTRRRGRPSDGGALPARPSSPLPGPRRPRSSGGRRRPPRSTAR